MKKEIKKPLSESNRTRKATIASIVGIISNLALAVAKILVGAITNSIAIVGDGLNNASDCLSSVITLVGFRLSKRPADKDHPFGHERYEYIVGLILSFLVITVGIELAKSSIESLLRADSVSYDSTMLIVLGVAIIVKLLQGLYYISTAHAIDSDTLKAAATDSISDVLTTAGVLVSAIVSMIFGLNIDAYVGIIISIIILINGVKLIKDSTDPLLGTLPSLELQNQLKEYLTSIPTTLGVHDLMVHSYGPYRKFASVHLEMNSDIDPIKSHDIIDNIEHEVEAKFNIHIVIHHDPVVVNETTTHLKEVINTCLSDYDSLLHIHDLRMVTFTDFDRLIFDIEIPFDCKHTQEDILNCINVALEKEPRKYQLMPTFDRV